MPSGRLLWRFVAIFTSFAVIIIIFIGITLNVSIQTSYYDAFKRTIESGLVLWSDYRGFSYSNMDNTSVYEIKRLLTDENDGRNFFDLYKAYRTYAIFDAGGKTVICSNDRLFNPSGENKDLLLSILSSKNAVKVMAGADRGDSSTLVYEHEDAYFDYAVGLDLKEGSYVLYFRYDRNEWLGTVNSINRNILTSLLTAVFVSMLLGLVMSKAVTDPLVRIKDKARELAAGNFDVKLEVAYKDEIGDLTSSFNYMAAELKEMMIAISSEKNKVETLLNYMTDGVIAFDTEGNMTHVNPAAYKLVDIKQDITYAKFAEKYDITYGYEELFSAPEGKTFEKTIKSGDRYIKALFAIYSDREHKNEGMIIVLQDITEHERIDQMRKEFVENVSHELKTPLATIKSYVETLLDGALEDPEIASKFMGVVNSEADRMTRLVKDLLLLSSIDYLKSGGKSITLEKRRISMVEMAQSCTEKLRIEAENKKQTLICTPDKQTPYIIADRDRMEQVILNLIGNAIKYTAENGKISVTTGIQNNSVWLKVEDDGIGIRSEELDKIFDRFRRVDKARSRGMGGTGLGLAIAKEIVELHDGRIDMNSEPGKGTIVTVYMPVGEVFTKIGSGAGSDCI